MKPSKSIGFSYLNATMGIRPNLKTFEAKKGRHLWGLLPTTTTTTADTRRLPGIWGPPPNYGCYLFFSFRFIEFSSIYIFLLKANHFRAPAGQTLVRGSGRHFLVITILFWSLFWGDPLDRGSGRHFLVSHFEGVRVTFTWSFCFWSSRCRPIAIWKGRDHCYLVFLKFRTATSPHDADPW